MTAPARRVLVRDMTSQGVSERRALALVRMSASSLRYTPAPDTNAALRARIVALAHQHRRYGAGMIYLKLRQAGALVNHQRVERLYTEARLQVRRRRRKKIPVADRQPLIRPQAPNEVWSADFVFDRTADGRVVKCLTVVDDATTEAVAIVPARTLGGAGPSCVIRTHTRGAEGARRKYVELSSTRRAQDNGGHGLLSGWSRSLRFLRDDRLVPPTRGQHRTPCGS